MMLRGISASEIRLAIDRDSKQIQRPDKILYSYRYFCVVAKKVKNTYFIITIKPR